MFLHPIKIDDDLVTAEVRDFLDVCDDAANLYSRKNHDYGDSFSKGMDTIGIAYGIGRIYDKVNRLITLSKLDSIAETAVNNESIEDTLMDLGCYSFMLLAYRRNKAKQARENVVLE